MKRNNRRWILGCWSGIVVFLGGQAASSAANPVFINEVLANNTSYADINGNTPDWVELYNPSDADVELVGLYLSTSRADAKRWAFREGSKVRAKSFLIIYCDDKTVAGSINTGFGLGAGGDALFLFDNATNAVDSVTFGMQVPDFSIGRSQIAGSPWMLCKPTQNAVNEPATLGNTTALRINEWMADPASGDDWFEIYNPSAAPVALGGLYLTDDLNKPALFTIPALCFIGTQANGYLKFQASKTPEKGPNHTSFKLSKSGASLGLASAAGWVDKVTFGAQSLGVSQGRLPDGGASWAYFPQTSSPGESNYLPLSNVVVNEILTHTDPPQEDAIELYNASPAEVNLGGWYLTDSPSNWRKYQIPSGTKIAAHGYLVFSESQFGNTNAATAFNLNSSEGDSVYLSMADAQGNLAGYRSDAHFGAAPNGVPFARHTNSVGEVSFPLETLLTLGEVNASPRVGPVVISELMYHPKDIVLGEDNADDEYIELLNVSANEVTLYHPLEPTNTWHLRGAVKFDLPQGVSLAPGGRLLVVGFNPTSDSGQLDAFRVKYGVPATVAVLGPYDGKLKNSGDRLSLEEPDPIQGQGHINEGFVPYYWADSVKYADSAPWPTAADGSGSALQRKDPLAFADDPANWIAASPLPGRAKGATGDTDGDGMPDSWESANGLNSNNATDANTDLDGDGLTNLQEYLAGTNPRDPKSRLSFDSVKPVNGRVALSFTSVALRNYMVQKRDSMIEGSWIELQKVTAPSAGGSVTVEDTNLPVAGTRFYRLIINY